MNALLRKERLSAPPRSIAIVRALPGLGDLLCCVPALRALRSAFPMAKVTLIGLPSAQGFVQRFSHYLDDLLEFPGFPGIPEVPFAAGHTATFLMEVQQSFDLVLQMHGNGSCINGFALLMGARQTAGFYPADRVCSDADFLPYPEHEPEIWRHLRLLEFLGIPLQGDQLEFPYQARSEELAQQREAAYICIHPGASVADRRCSPQHFASIGDALAAQGYQVILTGVKSEMALTQTVAQLMQFPALNLAGQTSLDGMATLLKQAQILICNDTGVSHLAAALQTKSVVIFSNSEPHRWAPLDRQRHQIVRTAIEGHTPDRVVTDVLTAATGLLQQEQIYVS